MLMIFTQFLGYLSGFFALSFSVAQIHRLKKIGSSEGISALLWQLFVGVQVGWVTYGLYIKDPSFYIPSTVCGLVGIIILSLYYKFLPKKHKKWYLVFVPAIFFASLFILIVHYSSPTMIGLAFIVPNAFGQISQLFKIEHDADIKGISVNMLLLYVFNQSVNLIWGILIFDTVLKMTALSGMTILTISIVAYYYRLKQFKKSQ